jgi:hypothetical protein
MNAKDSIRWLERKTTEYCLGKNDIREVVEDLGDEGKLWPGFSSIDELEEVDIGSGGVRRPTYINTNLSVQEKSEIRELL